MSSYWQQPWLKMFNMVIVVSFCPSSSGTNICPKREFPGSTVNHRLTQSIFLVYNSTGLVDCIRYCRFHSVCLSVNFNTASSECELNGSVTGRLEAETSFLHVDVTHAPAPILGSCRNHNCGVRERCQPNDGSGYTCVLVGCAGSPEFTNINASSFDKNALWPFGKTVEYACDDGCYPSANAVCQANGTWNFFECRPFESCDDILKCGKPPNGEFWLEFFPGFQKVKIFCFLSMTKGYSFATLTKPNYSIMASDIRVSNTSCESQSQTLPHNNTNLGETHFYKIYLYRPGGFIKIDQMTYTNSTGNEQLLATAGDCFTTNDLCDMKGSFVFDLQGTGLKITDAVNWKVQGPLARMKILKSPDGLQVNGSCGGFCGGCLRENKIFFERDPTYVPPPLDTATILSCPLLK